LLGTLGVGLLVWGVLYFGLDPWLKRKLEKAVAQQTDGRYALHLDALRTRLADGSITLTNVRLRPTGTFRPGPDSLPKLALDLPRFRVGGLSLWAFWQKQPQHLDSLTLTGLRMEVDSLPKSSFRQRKPLHQLLPARLPGLTLDFFVVRDARALYRGRRRPRLAFQRLDLTGQHVRLDSVGASDTTRLAYAQAWRGHLRQAQLLFDHHRGRIRRLDFDSKTGLIAGDSLRVRPTRIGRRGPAYLTLGVGSFRLTGLQASGLLQKRFRADSLRIAGLRFDLTAPDKPPPPFHKMLASVFRRLDLHDLRLLDGYVQLRGIAHAPIIRDLQLHAEYFRVDSLAYQDPRRVVYALRWDGSTGAAQVPLDPPFYRVGYERVAFDTRPGTLQVTNAVVEPVLSIAETARRKGHEITQLTVHVPKVRVSGADFSAFTRHDDLIIREIAIQAPRILINSDSRYRIGPRESIVTPEAVRKIPFRLDLRRIVITNGRMDFRFIGTTSPHYGSGNVRNLTGTLTNATNDPARMSARTPLVAHATGIFQGKCKVEAHAQLNLLDPQGRHTLTGTFSPAPFQMLNPITEPSSLMTFKNGQAQGIEVELRGNRTHVSGTMRARYAGMHVRFLTPDLDQNLLTKIKSKAANKLVLHDNNPDKPNEPLRVGRIESKRERRFSVFALWKQGLVCGVLTSFGVGEKMAQRTSEATTEPGE
jgi:hypothetical protein